MKSRLKIALITDRSLPGEPSPSSFNMESRAIALYRQSLRVLRDLPVPAVRRKMAYNIRELFSIYKDAPPHKIEEVIQDGTRDLELLREIFKGRKELVYNLFKTFENLNQEGTEASHETDKEYDHSREILPL